MTEKIDYKEDVVRPVAVFETSMGTFEAELYAKECPETAWNFIVSQPLLWPIINNATIMNDL